MTSRLRSPVRLAGITLIGLLSAVPACGESSATTDETPISGDAGSGGDAGAAGASAGTGGTAGKGGSGGSAAGKGGASGASGQAGGGAAGKGGAGGSTAGSAGTAGGTAGAAGTAGKGGTGGSTAGAGGSTAGAGGSVAGAAGTGGSAAGAAGTGGSVAGAAGTGGSAGAGGATATECTVGGKTYADGAADPTNPCRSCQVAVSSTDFSPVPDTTSCGVARVCDAGKCLEPTVFTIVLENTSYEKVVGDTTNVPYLNSLIAKYGLATKYSDSGTHPSLPNYLYMISGETQYLGVIDLEPTQGSFPVDKDNLGLQLTTAGVPWRAYMESMGTPCGLATKGTYAPKHNPFVYFKSLQNNSTLCAQLDVDYSLFAADLAAGNYRYMWITPNLDSDGHDTDIATADKWCAANVPAILDSEVFKKNGYLFITWDEGSGTILTSDHIAMIVASPHLKSAGYTTDVAYNHASYLATVEDMYKVPRLGAAKNAATMFEFFK